MKDAFHPYVVEGRKDSVNPRGEGMKAAALYPLGLGPAELHHSSSAAADGESAPPDFDQVFAQRTAEADEFYGMSCGRATRMRRETSRAQA